MHHRLRIAVLRDCRPARHGQRGGESASETNGISAPGETTAVYTFVPDLNTPRRLETLATLLARRGRPERVIDKVLGGNFLRLFNETWPAA